MEEFDFSEYNLTEKEERVLKSAIYIFSKKGFSGSTTKEIAKNAGVSEGTVFKYFKTKKGILKAIVLILINSVGGKFVTGSMEKILINADDKDLKETLKLIFYDRMKRVEILYPMAKVVLVEALTHDDVREAIYENIISRARVMFAEFHKTMSDKGVLRNDVSPDTILRAIVGNFALFILQSKLFGDKFDFKDLDSELDKQIDLILNGIMI